MYSSAIASSESFRAGASSDWAVRLRWVFNIDVSRCGGTARIENPEVIRRFLTHLAARDRSELSGVGGMCVYTNYAPLAAQWKIVP